MPLRRKFILIAGLSAVIYLLVFSLPYPLSQHYNKIPPVDYAKLSNYSVGGIRVVPRGAGDRFRLVPVGAASGHA